jgi:hypothetical protein
MSNQVEILDLEVVVDVDGMLRCAVSFGDSVEGKSGALVSAVLRYARGVWARVRSWLESGSVWLVMHLSASRFLEQRYLRY